VYKSGDTLISFWQVSRLGHASLTLNPTECTNISLKSVPITTNVVSSNPVQCEVYSIQHYVIRFVSDLGQVGGFLRVLRFHPPITLTATIRYHQWIKLHTVISKVIFNCCNKSVNALFQSLKPSLRVQSQQRDYNVKRKSECWKPRITKK
jgi:hypothetical protein